MNQRTNCRACGLSNLQTVLVLGTQPPSNALLIDANQPQKTYPLTLLVCLNCCLMQTSVDVPHSEIFGTDYPYYSGSSHHWRLHCRDYAVAARHRFGLTADSYVVEVGGNDGTLLRNFDFCRTLNVEPSVNVARAAMARNVPTFVGRFQDVVLAEGGADLIIANNVMAHDPDLNGFAAALAYGLKPTGVATIEFPSALRMLETGAFDTIYHEHYSYLSLTALIPLLAEHDLHIFDVETLPTHGGSLRAYVRPVRINYGLKSYNVFAALEAEQALQEVRTYEIFRERAYNCSGAFHAFLQHAGPLIGMGAAAKAAVFANFCHLNAEDILMVGDTTPAKWGKFMPGSRIPIVTDAQALAQQPEYLWIGAWNWKDEIAHNARSMGYKGKFVTAIPELQVFE